LLYLPTPQYALLFYIMHKALKTYSIAYKTVSREKWLSRSRFLTLT